MTNAVLRIIGERQAEGSAAPAPVTATIYDAEPTGHGDFACRVSIPAIFEEDRHIFGVDEDHALEVSASFVRNLFEGLSINIRQEESAL
jgi:hypothetical protein